MKNPTKKTTFVPINKDLLSLQIHEVFTSNVSLIVLSFILTLPPSVVNYHLVYSSLIQDFPQSVTIATAISIILGLELFILLSALNGWVLASLVSALISGSLMFYKLSNYIDSFYIVFIYAYFIPTLNAFISHKIKVRISDLRKAQAKYNLYLKDKQK
jgi:hypothetical protein